MNCAEPSQDGGEGDAIIINFMAAHAWPDEKIYIKIRENEIKANRISVKTIYKLFQFNMYVNIICNNTQVK